MTLILSMIAPPVAALGSLVLAQAGGAAEVWKVIGTWALTAVCASLLGGVLHLFGRVSGLARQVGELEKQVVVRADIDDMIIRAGIYSTDRNAIAQRLDNHAQQIAELQRSMGQLQTQQGHISATLERICKALERQDVNR